MTEFLQEDFLLNTETARTLYHEYAKEMPIIDYHCHLSPKEIYENKQFKNITEVWLYGDHYKWRAMRSNGVDEKNITGDGSDYDKFFAFAGTLPMAIGNPLYHWVHLELRRYFGISDILNEKTAPKIWEQLNSQLTGPGFGAQDLIKKSNVRIICTTDDPVDTLEYHKKIKQLKDFEVKVMPTFRPDKGVEIKKETFTPWLKKLEETVGYNIKNYEEFCSALKARIEYFDELGGKLADHGLDYVPYEDVSYSTVNSIFDKAINHEKITDNEADMFKTAILQFLAKNYTEKGWVMQLHINAMRNNNTQALSKIGPDTGFDSINDSKIAYSLSRLLDSMNKQGALPKTIIYSLNAADNDILGTMIGNFQGDCVPGKIQFGAAWWFNDNKEGMISQMKSLASMGLLGRFVGMLTDSRSFLSYTRHEYFRRILCNLIGEWVENGEYPNDMEMLSKIVKGICYNNAKEYFNL